MRLSGNENDYYQLRYFITSMNIIEARMKQEPDIINDSEESVKLFKSYAINSNNDKTNSTKIKPEEIEFIEDTRDLFKLPIDYREWNERNLDDWLYWIKMKLRFKFPNISRKRNTEANV